LGVQILAIVIFFLWSGLLSGLYFGTLKFFKKFRVPLIYEVLGLDYIEHGASMAVRY
jgi:ammonia channel protein AmtB